MVVKAALHRSSTLYLGMLKAAQGPILNLVVAVGDRPEVVSGARLLLNELLVKLLGGDLLEGRVTAVKRRLLDVSLFMRFHVVLKLIRCPNF
jgi:hypothetical protein